MSNFLNMKNNLIQNFYIIGVTKEDIDSKYKSISLSSSNSIFTPKVISKFPDINSNYNEIPNEIIIEHCFPIGYRTIKGKKSDLQNNVLNFWFELDNSKYKYLSKYQKLYSKIYFTCLLFYESFIDYDKLQLEINLKDKANNKDENKSKENTKNLNNLNEENTIFFPKILCFASLIPFHKELAKILRNLYDYFLFYKENIGKKQNEEMILINDISPIEKIIEQIVMCIPIPISIRNDYNVLYKFHFPINITKENPQNKKTTSKSKSSNLTLDNKNESFPFSNTSINFEAYDPLNPFMDNTRNIFLFPIFYFFTEEDVIKIFKYIILEIPILFFNDNIEVLTGIITGFLNLLEPFEYVQPHISVLPSKLYGIINTEYKFIFGINEKYFPDFFKNNGINLDKSIIAVYFFNEKAKIEEIKKFEEPKESAIIDNYNIFNYINNEPLLPNGVEIDLINIEFPLKLKKKLVNKIKNILNEEKKKKGNISDESKKIFNEKIRYCFYRFFVNILAGYTDYFQKIYKYDANDANNDGFYLGDNIRFKINYINNFINDKNNLNNNIQTLFIKSIFNIDEFISKFPKDNHIFYEAFCNTKLFYDFIRKNIFYMDEQISLSNKYFNALTFFKIHKQFRKKYKYKDNFMSYKKLFKEKKNLNPHKKIFINILNDMNFSLKEKDILLEKKDEILSKFNQILNTTDSSTNEKIILKYIIFPKLFFDNSFFNLPYSELFYKHYLDIPTNSEILYLYKHISKLRKDLDEKYENLIYSKTKNEINNSGKNLIDLSRTPSNELLNSGNNTVNIGVLLDNYIEYNWLLLISCSLWYCETQREIDNKISKILNVLEKIDLIEEQALFFVFMSIYKYGAKSDFIKMLEFINRFMGYSSYNYLLYMCLKLRKNEKEINNNINTIDNKNEIIEEKNIIKNRSFFDIAEIKNNIDLIKFENSDDLNLKKEYSSGNMNQKEEIQFYTLQICPKCKAENKIENIYDIIHHRISKKRENLFYKCNKCGENKLDINIRYRILKNNKKKGDSLAIKGGKFKLISPHKIYKEIKEYLLNLNNCQLDIDNIFMNEKIYLLNNIFYFSDKSLSFDFLIPYEGKGNREYFFEDEENIEEEEDNNNKNEIIIENVLNKNPKQKFEIFSINKDINFSLINKK